MINKILYVLPGFMAVEFRDLMDKEMNNPNFDRFCEDYYRHVLVSPKSKIKAPKKFFENYTVKEEKVAEMAQKGPQNAKYEGSEIEEYKQIELDLNNQEKDDSITVVPVEPKKERTNEQRYYKQNKKGYNKTYHR